DPVLMQLDNKFLAAGCVPHRHRVFPFRRPGTRQPSTVEADGHPVPRAAFPSLCLFFLWRLLDESTDRPAADGVVELYSPLTGDGQGAVRVEGQHSSPEGRDPLEAGRVPHLHGAVPGPAGQSFAVGAEGHAQDTASMPAEGHDLLASRWVP